MFDKARNFTKIFATPRQPNKVFSFPRHVFKK